MKASIVDAVLAHFAIIHQHYDRPFSEAEILRDIEGFLRVVGPPGSEERFNLPGLIAVFDENDRKHGGPERRKKR